MWKGEGGSMKPGHFPIQTMTMSTWMSFALKSQCVQYLQQNERMTEREQNLSQLRDKTFHCTDFHSSTCSPSFTCNLNCSAFMMASYSKLQDEWLVAMYLDLGEPGINGKVWTLFWCIWGQERMELCANIFDWHIKRAMKKTNMAPRLTWAAHFSGCTFRQKMCRL